MATFGIGTEGDVVVLSVTGKLGLESLDAFQQALTGVVDGAGVTVIIDLSDCPYMSSRSFPPLLHATDALKAAERQLLVVVNGGLMEILKILRLDGRLALFESRSQALEVATV